MAQHAVDTGKWNWFLSEDQYFEHDQPIWDLGIWPIRSWSVTNTIPTTSGLQIAKNNDFGANATKKKGLPTSGSPFYLLLDTVDICNKHIFSNIFSTCTVNRLVNIKKTCSNHGLKNTNRTQHSSRGGFSSPTCTDTSEISQIVLPRASDGEAACQWQHP
jgi:hypothetical protein